MKVTFSSSIAVILTLLFWTNSIGSSVSATKLETELSNKDETTGIDEVSD